MPAQFSTRSFDRPPYVMVLLMVLVSLACIGQTPSAYAVVFTLTDQNSSLELDPTLPATGFNWFVEGVDHLAELSNWYRVGPAGPEAPVSSLIIGTQILSDNHGDAGFDTLTVEYIDPGLRFVVEIDYAVFGSAPGSGASAIDEEIRITNTTTLPLEFHMFEYINLDLDNSPGDDTNELTGPNSLVQQDPRTVSNWGFEVDRHELEIIGSPTETLLKLNDPFASDLSSVWPAGAGPRGPDDVTFALQWDFEGFGGPRPAILPFETATIRKTGGLQMIIIPEPVSATLLGLGFVAVVGGRRPSRATTL